MFYTSRERDEKKIIFGFRVSELGCMMRSGPGRVSGRGKRYK
jgi:hypothetical protein